MKSSKLEFRASVLKEALIVFAQKNPNKGLSDSHPQCFLMYMKRTTNQWRRQVIKHVVRENNSPAKSLKDKIPKMFCKTAMKKR